MNVESRVISGPSGLLREEKDRNESVDRSWRRREDGTWYRNVRARIPLLQRTFEVLFSVAALIVFAPLMLIVALIVKLDSPGPALFSQTRVGLNGKPIRFYKFRSQYVDSKERFPDWCAYEYGDDDVNNVRIQVEDDPRVTPAGRWLRRTSLDELPNLWSVLTGDIALVGPRPELWQMLKYYNQETLEKFSVRPGITGLAQVCGRGFLTFGETNDFDLEYVRTRSWRLDLAILLKTAYQTLVGEGAM